VVTVLAGLNGLNGLDGLDGLGLCPGLGRWRHLRGRRVGRQGVTKELFHLGILQQCREKMGKSVGKSWNILGLVSDGFSIAFHWKKMEKVSVV
jgi:hypothetical protein